MDLLTWGLVSAIAALAIHWLWKWYQTGLDAFEKRGIPFLKPVPLVGNFWPVFMKKTTIKDFMVDVYNKYPGSRIIGMFDKKTPVYFIRDPELIKQMAVKDFEHFIDHRVVFDGKDDPLFGNVLINLTGQKWKDMRSTMSVIFTGSKMRQMFDLMSESGAQFGEYFGKVTSEERNVEMRDTFRRFALDVIALTNFGVKVDSLRDRNNHFYTQVQNFLDQSGFMNNLRLLLFVFWPGLIKKLKISIVPKHKSQFVVDLVNETEKTREEKGIVRPDFINLLMEIKKGQLKHEESSEDIGFATTEEAQLGKGAKRTWSDDELMAQAFLFFLAGFETVAVVASFIAYEVATHPEIQKKLIEEVDSINRELGGKNLTYEALQKMKYLDMVISEGLRFWPNSDMTDRACHKDYTLKNDQGRDIVIEKGSQIIIPIVALHFSEEFYENPDKFDPERFSDENRDKINKDAYLPFGVGPRNCIGSRFALMEMKTAFFYLLRSFTLEVTDKTDVPLKLLKGLEKKAENGINLRLEPRKQI